MAIAVSIVSHGHGEMVWSLVPQILACPEISKLFLTINIPENVPEFPDPRVVIVRNESPKGYGANHNAAFKLNKYPCFCVLNPDIIFTGNPFPELLRGMGGSNVGLIAPLILGGSGQPEDSMRVFLTPWSLLKRVLGIELGAYVLAKDRAAIHPDWIAGMFMLFSSKAYSLVNGFDERYFMYCEDADICTRLWKSGYTIVGCLSTSVIHNAQRASHRSFKHLSWHARSMIRYFFSHSFSLPSKGVVIRLG